MTRVVLALMIAGSLLPACAFDATPQCRITAIGADARLNAQGEELHIYDYRFVADSVCGDTHVQASYNTVTKEAQEKLERPGASATGRWICHSDPWIDTVFACQQGDTSWIGNVQPSAVELEHLENGGIPIGLVKVADLDKTYLRGQLGNALARLQAQQEAAAGDDTVEYGGGFASAGPRTGTGFTNTAPAAPAAPPQAPNPTTGQIIQLGSKGMNVEALQLLLNQHGQDVDVDGDFGPQTEGAVRDFQKDSGLPQDGKVGQATWTKLWVTVRKGSAEDDAVRAAQTLLGWHQTPVVVDGDFGDLTEAAVRSFQTNKKLGVDGIVGPQTWTALVNTP